ncbi:MAG: hypothetical protein DRJ40_08160 [Thermoprotei archaeon]|nr:MAG: hypothetical protein DRJ40_08160 [Thermoprotei archaeon]
MSTVEKVASELEKALEEYLTKNYSDKFGIGHPVEYLKPAFMYCIKVASKLAKNEDEFWHHYSLCMQDVIATITKGLDISLRELKSLVRERAGVSSEKK